LPSGLKRHFYRHHVPVPHRWRNAAYLPPFTANSVRLGLPTRERPIDVLYQSSRCEERREQLVGVVRRALEAAVLVFEYTGLCTGGSQKPRLVAAGGPEAAIRKAKMVVAFERFQPGMEYLSEKPFLPVRFGAVPLYYGNGQRLAASQGVDVLPWIDRADSPSDEAFAERVVTLARDLPDALDVRRQRLTNHTFRIECAHLRDRLRSLPLASAGPLRIRHRGSWAKVYEPVLDCLLGERAPRTASPSEPDPHIILSQCCYGKRFAGKGWLPGRWMPTPAEEGS